MQKNKSLFKNIFFYILCFIISSISISSIPVGAISVFTMTYASGIILTPNIILSTISIILFGNIPYLLVYIFYILLFLSFTILLKPLVAVHEIYEKLNVEKYLISILFYLNFFITSFGNNIFICLMTFSIYKTLVNILPMLKNEKNKLVFSNFEIGTLYMFFILISQFVLFKLNVSFGLNMLISLIISFLITNMLITLCLFKTNLKTALILLIISSLTYSLFFKVFMQTLPMLITLIFFAIIKNYSKKDSIAALSIYTILCSILFLVNNQYVSAINLLIISGIMLLNIFKVKIFDLGFILNLNGYIPSFGEHNFSYVNDPKFLYKKIYNKDKFTSFKEKLTQSEGFKNNILYDEIIQNDDILRWIFYSLDKKSLLDISEFNEILISNNVLIPITNDYFKNTLNDIENLSFVIFKSLDNNIDSNDFNIDADKNDETFIKIEPSIESLKDSNVNNESINSDSGYTIL